MKFHYKKVKDLMHILKHYDPNTEVVLLDKMIEAYDNFAIARDTIFYNPKTKQYLLNAPDKANNDIIKKDALVIL